MTRQASRGVAEAKPINLAEERTGRAAETEAPETVRQSLERFVASVAARWRGREPEVAVLSTTTLILAIGAAFAGADVFFTSMMLLVAAVTIWSPWRPPS